MAHREQLKFIEIACKAFNSSSTDLKILEIGSYDVNGSIRKIMPKHKVYIGVDLSEGPGVDLIASGHTVKLDEQFDIVLSCECFEHNPFWKETFLNMHDHLQKDGVMIVTCASTGRVEHGTDRTNRLHSPGTASVGINYYQNLTKSDLVKNLDLPNLFAYYDFFECKASNDLYFIGQKIGTEKNRINVCRNEVQMIELISGKKRGFLRQTGFLIYRFPLNLASRLLSHDVFQNFAVKYDNTWNRLHLK